MTHELRDDGSCSCGFYPSSMSDQPGEAAALHICQANGHCTLPKECRIFAKCHFQRSRYPWL